MKHQVKHFSATQINNLSYMDALKTYKPAFDWILSQKEDVTTFTSPIDSNKAFLIEINFDKKANEIYINPAPDAKIKFATKVFKVGKWDDVNLLFLLSIASCSLTKEEKSLSDTQKATFILEDILHYVNSNK